MRSYAGGERILLLAILGRDLVNSSDDDPLLKRRL